MKRPIAHSLNHSIPENEAPSRHYHRRPQRHRTEIIYQLLADERLLTRCTPIVYGQYDGFEAPAEKAGAIAFQQVRAVGA